MGTISSLVEYSTMKIYLKGYYGYQNFGDELLLFGVIEEIFSRYQIEHLVIEVGNKERIQSWIKKNQSFIATYYKSRNVAVNWEKVSFFEPHTFFKKKKTGIFHKRNQYFQIFLGKHPYRSYFKLFGGGEVIDESRSFPHNGRNLLLLYFRSIWKGNFGLLGGLGSQNSFWTRILTKILCKKADFLYLRDKNSYTIALKYRDIIDNTVQLGKDFSYTILNFFVAGNKSNHQNDKILLNLSPSFDIKLQEKLKKNIKGKQIIFFPCDMNYDIQSLQTIFPKNKIPIFDRREYEISEILDFLSHTSFAYGTRLHFLYCCKFFAIPYAVLSKSKKLETNL